MKKLNGMRSWKRRLAYLGIPALILLLAGVIFWTGQKKKAKEVLEESRKQVETVQVKKQNLMNSIGVTGTIESADSRDVEASAKDVEVLEVHYQPGDYVNEGDVIVVLDSTDLELALEQAKNSQTLSEYTENKSIETATENYTEAVENGTDTYNKAVRAEADAKEALQEAEDELSGAVSRLKRREERIAAADAAWEPYANMTEEELLKLTEEEKEVYDAVYAEYGDAHASYTEAHQAYEAAAAAEEKAVEVYESAAESLSDARKENDRTISTAEDTLDKARMEHEYSNNSSQKTIENYEDQIASCTVRAPISGILTAVNVDVGDTYMGEGSALFSVADPENFKVSASVDEYDVSSIFKDMQAAVIVDAIGEEELPATVSFVSPVASEANTGSAGYDLEITLNEENTDLRIGMTAKASIVLDAVYDVLTVPYDCVEEDEEGNAYIYIDQNGQKAQVPVEVGMRGDYYVEISGDGIDENTMVYYPSAMVGREPKGSDSGGETVVMPAGGMALPVGGPGGF